MELSPNAIDILEKRYLMEGEDWEKCCRRVGRIIAQYEAIPQEWEDIFSETIYNCDFIPGGRVIRNAGRPRGSLFNCFFIPVEDSIESIARMIGDCLRLWAAGGGVGLNLSTLRPEGDAIKGKGGESSGLVSFLHAADAVASTIQSGGQRRAAAICLIHCSHPEIIKFINAKLKDGKLSNFNISVGVTEEFLEAVENDKDWTFTFRGRPYDTIKARTLWDLIVTNMLKSAEPGLINWTNLTRNNTYYFHPIQGVNPCLSGDTLIAVADGRNAVRFDQLAAEGKDVPVYSFSSDGRIEIQMLRNPTKTRSMAEIWKVHLDDGSYVKATKDHTFYLTDGERKKVKDLLKGDSLQRFDAVSHRSGYRFIKNTHSDWFRGMQYKIIHEFHKGSRIEKGNQIHHIDYNKLNDAPENLREMTLDAHMQLHGEHMLGKNNPFCTHKNIPFTVNIGSARNGRRYNTSYNKDAAKVLLKQSNHKVVCVEFCGYEDVFNGAVDNNKNYAIITSSEDDKFVAASGIVVANCSEACLGAWEACNLGSINLSNFITGTRTDWKRLEAVVYTSVRFMDNVINSNRYEIDEIERNAHNSRRIGLGTMGLGDYLFKKEIRYGSKQSIDEIEKLYKFIKETAYESSIKLAEERGTFPAFDKTMYCKADFVKRLPTRIKKAIKEFGIRNSTLLAQAPTGTISLIPEVTPGIEPLFSKAYRATDNAGVRYYIHPLYREILKTSSKVPEWFVDAYDIPPNEHFEVQVAVGNHTDASVSKTVNLPKSTKVEELSELLLSYIWDIKGTTVYRDGCREGQPLERISEKEARKHLDNENYQDEAAVECARGTCGI